MKPTIALLLALALTAAVPPTVDAGVWDRALATPEDGAARELYDAKMLEGDTATLSAMTESASTARRMESIRRAEAAYRAAAATLPAEAEPHFRIANLIYQLHFSCNALHQLATCGPPYATTARMRAAVAAWDEFEKRAPLDPRVGDILVQRALLNTRAVAGASDPRPLLEAAVRDYEAAIARVDGLSDGPSLPLLNLAEAYMMLGRLEESIATYLRTIASGAARVSTIYGLAVALDRDGEGAQARRRILSQGTAGFESFQREFMMGSVFYVPEGEANYYFALVHEAFGHTGTAIDFWQRYIDSGAHPEFQPRAREHLAQLRAKRTRPSAASPDPDSEL